MSLNEEPQEEIGRCAEQNTLNCKFDKEGLCRECSVWQAVNQLISKRTTKRKGVVESLVEIRCSNCPTEIILKFDVNLHLLSARDLPITGWMRNEKYFWICLSCSLRNNTGKLLRG